MSRDQGFNPIIRRAEDKPRSYVLEALRGMARSAGVDPEELCAVRFNARINEINSAACLALVGELKQRLACIPPGRRAAGDVVPQAPLSEAGSASPGQPRCAATAPPRVRRHEATESPLEEKHHVQRRPTGTPLRRR